ncbi:MAG: Ppx/GppA family phosphatase [Hyphomonadaceae bacterium]|nr:Ppx/GppA family phosphatase [Hyphomonadaceae bacterium]
MDNESVPTKLTRIGIIDIGSNSVRFMIYDLFGSAFTPIYNEKVLAGLGRDLRKTGKLHPDGSARAFNALKRFKYIADAQGLKNILIAATAALRDASDAPDFIERVRDEIGFDIDPMSGEREAYVSSLGVLAGDSRAWGIAADLGGASLELTTFGGEKPQDGMTFPLGPFSVYQGKFDPAEIEPKVLKVFNQSSFKNLPKHQPLFMIGGAWRNLALIHQKRINYPIRIAHNYQMDTQEASDLGRWACGEGAEDLFNYPGISARRADTLPYSGLLMRILIELLEPSEIVISAGGLRDGLIYESLPDRMHDRTPLFDACRDLARGRSQSTHFGEPLIKFLADIDPYIPSVFPPDNEARLRKAACYLVGIGKGLHPDHRAKLSMKTVLFAPIPGLKHKERAYLALMLYASYSSKAAPPNEDAINYFLNEDEQLAARIYGEAMRFAVVLSGRSGNVLSRQRLSMNDDALELFVDAEFDGLIVERCLYRLNKLAKLAGFKLPKNGSEFKS